MTSSFQDMQLFVAAYEERSFTAAAARENATQSGVSQHMRKLEQLMKVKLFVRDSEGVMPTPAATRFYHHCVEVLRAHQAAHQAMVDYAGGLEGEITIGLMPTLTRCVLAPALARFIELHPNMIVRVVEGYSSLLTQQTHAGELDFAIVPWMQSAPGLKSHLFLRSEEVMVSGLQRGISPGPKRLSELGGLKLVVPNKGNTRRELLNSYFASNGIQPEKLVELDAMMGTLDFVANTDWVTILPAVMMAKEAEGPLRVNRIIDPAMSLDLTLIELSRRPMHPGAEAFRNILHEEATRINAWARL